MSPPGQTMHFCVQSYDTMDNSVVVIHLPDARELFAFPYTDFKAGFPGAGNIGGVGHHLSMTFIDEDNATATRTQTGSDPVGWTLIRTFMGFAKGGQGDADPTGPDGDMGLEGPQGEPGGFVDLSNKFYSNMASVPPSTLAVVTVDGGAGEELMGGGMIPGMLS